ncbi:MAG: aminoglycoside phosphotransferase family protein [Solirubrobacteraceae bacterium MAG38_C4-C5]|nr:aminoglycoside phosphotransferase family protein [Candidatus Siliceabacter maunaloa]
MSWPEDDRLALAEGVATEVATRYGLVLERPRLLHHSNNVVLQLTPEPIIAKVGMSSHRRSAAASLTRELEVGRFLAVRRAPSARPASALPAGPHHAWGLVVTFWDYCANDPARTVEASDAGRSLGELHAALNGYDGPLPSFSAQIDDAAWILATDPLPALPASDRAFLTEAHAGLSAALSAHDLAARPLHGEPHSRNVLATPDGPCWIDFEAACLGPLEWDVACLGGESLRQFPHVDHDLLELMGRLRSLCVAVWCWMDPDRAPELREAAEHHLHRLRADA